MRFTPLFDRVIIRPAPDEMKSAGGIILTNPQTSTQQNGKVMAVGPGAYAGENLIPISVAVGADVIYAKAAGREIKIDGEDFVIMQEKDILGIIN